MSTDLKRDRLRSIAIGLRLKGVDPDKMARVSVFPDVIRDAMSGRWTVREVVDICRKIALVNRSLLFKDMDATEQANLN